MSEADDPGHVQRLIRELRHLPAETPWAEFKENNADPQMIGDTIAALSNAAALNGKETAYIVWGIADDTHAVAGTDFLPATARKGNQELESWLVQMLSPRLHIRFHVDQVDGRRVVVLEIPAARDRPTAFAGRELVRVGSVRRSLTDNPEMERALWRCFERTPFERQIAVTDLDGAEVLRRLDFPGLFERLGRDLPTDQPAILAALAAEDLIRRNDAGRWDITNLGAILIARDLTQFPTVARKALRLIIYGGKNRISTEREQEGRKGYAIGFEGLMTFLLALLPRNEVIGAATRRDVPMYPDLAIRELIANALIHQDFAVTGAGPMVEVFSDRIEVTNPGAPLGDVRRLLDQPPRSRNEALAAFMRRIGLCEERGSGVDKVVFETERYQLPPPQWASVDGFSRAVLFAHKELREMDKDERIHACYLHACLKREQRELMTNASLRERFGIEEHNASTASRLIREALDARVIKPFDPEQGKRNARYLPFWA